MSTPLPFAANVAKIEILGTLSGVAAVNVLHAKCSVAIVPGDMAVLATAVKNAWVTNMLPVQSVRYALTAVRCTDLTSLSGEQALANSGAAGTNGGTPAPANAALVVTVNTAIRSRSSRGRVYIGGLRADSFDDAHSYSSVATAAVLAAFGAVQTAMEAAGGAGHWDFGVLSYYSGVDEVTKKPIRRATPQFTPATTLSANTRVDSQRRRMG